MQKGLAAIAGLLLLNGCVAGAAISAVGNVAEAGVKVTGAVVSAGVDAATPDRKDKQELRP